VDVERRGIDTSTNLSRAETLVSELGRGGALAQAERWFLALDFLRLAGMVDARPGDGDLARAYRVVADELSASRDIDSEFDPEVRAVLERIR
jgi:hypothetical protein